MSQINAAGGGMMIGLGGSLLLSGIKDWRSSREAGAAGLGVDPSLVVDAKWADNGPGWVAVLLDSAQTVLDLTPDQSRFGENNRVDQIGDDIWIGGNTVIGISGTVEL